MAITKEQLYDGLAKLGLLEGVREGLFHDLPGGGGGSSNVQMVAITAQDAPDPSPPGSGSAILMYTAPLPAVPFISVAIQDLAKLDDYEYTINVYPNPNGTSAVISVVATALETAPLEGAFPLSIAVRVEGFIPT